MAESTIPKPDPEPEQPENSSNSPMNGESKIYEAFGTVSECIGLLVGCNLRCCGEDRMSLELDRWAYFGMSYQ
jgi:hypothetical protein